MSELLLKVGTVGPDPEYQDGDILCAFNQKRILMTNAQNICNPWKFQKNQEGFLDVDSLPYKMYARTVQYRYELVKDKIFEYDQWDGGKVREVKMKKFQLWYRRRLKAWLKPNTNNGLPFFNTMFEPIWFLGNVKLDDIDIVTAVWNDIETDSPKRRVDNLRWPMGSGDKRDHLIVPVTDFTDMKAVEFVKPVYDDELKEEPIELKKRANSVPIESELLTSLKTTIEDVRDVTKEIDRRDEEPLDITKIVVAKN